MKKLLGSIISVFAFFALMQNPLAESASLSGTTSVRAGYTTTINIIANAANRVRGAEFNLSSNNDNIQITEVTGANGLTVSGSNGKYLVYKLESGFSVASGTVIAKATVKVKAGTAAGTKGTISVSNFKMTLADVTDTVNGSGASTVITVASEPVLSTDNTLASLTSDFVNIPFDKNTTNYSLTVGNNVNTLNLKAKTTNTNASVAISGDKDFKAGKNTVTVLVTAQNGAKKTYTITVTKESSSNNLLESLTVSTTPFTFDKNVYDYRITLTDSNITSLDIDYAAVDSKATVKITGNENFKTGENTVKITVTAENGEEKTYTIIVDKKVSNANPNNETDSEDKKESSNLMIHIAWGIITVMLIAVIGIQWSISKKENK